MSDVEAGVGASLDLGTYSLDAIAGLKASADSLAAQFKAWIDEEQAYQYGALDISLGGNGTTDSVPTDLAISLGGLVGGGEVREQFQGVPPIYPGLRGAVEYAQVFEVFDLHPDQGRRREGKVAAEQDVAGIDEFLQSRHGEG